MYNFTSAKGQANLASVVIRLYLQPTPKSKKRASLPTISYDTTVGQSFSSHFKKILAQVNGILKSLDHQPGFGDPLVKMLPKEHKG